MTHQGISPERNGAAQAPAIFADGIAIRRGNKTVINNVSCDFHGSGVHLIVGPNGSGKTTLLQAMSGQHPAPDGLLLSGMRPYNNEAVMANCVLMGADVALPENWTINKIFEFASRRWARTFILSRAREVADMFRLTTKKTYGQCSRGQKSAVGIAVALAAGVDYVFLDEPYLGLDLEKKAILYQLVGEEVAGREVLVVVATHEPDDVVTIAESVTWLGLDGSTPTLSLEEISARFVLITGPRSLLTQLWGGVVVIDETQLHGSVQLLVDCGFGEVGAAMLRDQAKMAGVGVSSPDLGTTISAYGRYLNSNTRDSWRDNSVSRF